MDSDALLYRRDKALATRHTGKMPGLCGCVQGRAMLQEGWVIANHILVSFHVAFISSVLAVPAASARASGGRLSR